MTTSILLISDIHANFPALEAAARRCPPSSVDRIINCGDSLVYATFPNETMDWLREHKTLSILGNTDRKVKRLLKGKNFKKPRMAEKRIMYTWTAAALSPDNRQYLATLGARETLELEGFRIGVFHGSPDSDDEFLFNDTAGTRLQELAAKTDSDIILCGHSHSPFHRKAGGVHFINPGSVGRMFDGNPAGSFALLELEPGMVRTRFFRCPYDIERVTHGLRTNLLPVIYEEMYRLGRKLN